MVAQSYNINIIFAIILSGFLSVSCQSKNEQHNKIVSDNSVRNEKIIKTGAERTELYFPLLEGKNIGVVTNQTGIIGDVHLIDSLLSANINIVKIFSPEHGFRGESGAGEKIISSIDPHTGIEIISLYGTKFKPTKQDIAELNIMVYDIQDVGVRFYTYISTMHYVMEACAEVGIPLIILDRPNPNGFYIDGPVLEHKYKSFIGMHPIPVVYGMTVGELAIMINDEGWLKGGIKCSLQVIPVENYTHKTLYHIPVAPSPNLQSMKAVYLYPSLCLFEGTVLSVGRGTDTPFEIIGHPLYPVQKFSFIPENRPGFAVNPPFMNEVCYGLKLSNFADSVIVNPKLEIKFLIDAYDHLHNKTDFFNPNMFDKLAGNSTLRKQIKEGKSEEEIRQSWLPQLEDFKQKRKKYLLYEDFY